MFINNINNILINIIECVLKIRMIEHINRIRAIFSILF